MVDVELDRLYFLPARTCYRVVGTESVPASLSELRLARLHRAGQNEGWSETACEVY